VASKRLCGRRRLTRTAVTITKVVVPVAVGVATTLALAPNAAAAQVEHSDVTASRTPITVTFHKDVAREYHTVRSGDTLYGITRNRFGNGNLWPRLYDANQSVVGANPNDIYPGETLLMSLGAQNSYGGADPPPAQSNNSTPSTTAYQVSSGTLGCSGLAALWIAAGGNPAVAITAAKIAMAESGGQQFATGSEGEEGYWQINPVNGALATYNALGNARSAIILSHDGTDWAPWTTYTMGLYEEEC
jgi:Lysozyme like domain/LysM domain